MEHHAKKLASHVDMRYNKLRCSLRVEAIKGWNNENAEYKHSVDASPPDEHLGHAEADLRFDSICTERLDASMAWEEIFASLE